MTKSIFLVSITLVISSLLGSASLCSAQTDTTAESSKSSHSADSQQESPTLYGGLATGGTRAPFKLQANLEYWRRSGSGVILQSQQGRLDPIVQQSIISLVQRSLPVPSRLPPFPLLAQLPVSSEPLTFERPRLLPLPAMPSSPLLTPRIMDAESARFDELCRNSLFRLSADFAKSSERLDAALSAVRENAQLNRSRFEDTEAAREIALSGAHQKIEQMQEHAEDVFGELRAKEPERREKMAQMLGRSEQLRAKLRAPELDNEALTTSARLVPAPANGVAETADSDLSWDEWYAGIANAIKEPLLAAVNKKGSPAGVNTVRITVWKDLNIKIELERAGNPDFDSAVVEAYGELKFTPVLEFPKGSKRRVVSFLSDHRHEQSGEAVDIAAHKLKGDVEHQSSSEP